MYIDTDAANKGVGPKIAVSSARSAETSPFLDSMVGQAPPPSYLEATTPNPWNRKPSEDEGARLLSFDGQRLEGDAEGGIFKGISRRRRSFREHCSRKRMLKWIGAIIFLIIFAAIVAAITNRGNKVTVAPIKIPAQPITSSTPAKSYPIRWPARCGKNYNSKTEEFTYGTLSDFSVNENVRQVDGPYKRVSGWIHVAQAPSDQAAGTIVAKMSYAVSDSVDMNRVKYSSLANGLTIGEAWTAGNVDGVQAGSTACLGISVVLYMATGAKLENFNVASVHLGMQIHAGVKFSVTNSTTISLTTGTLDASNIDSRETRLETISGSISGKYDLLDLLSVKTTSGSVNINVEPKEADNGVVKPAIFTATSTAGSIRADFERKNIPERDYQTSIETTVGSVDGTFIHGSKTSMETVAGAIKVDIMPFKSGDYPSTLTTSSNSGETKIKLVAPYKSTGSVMSGLTAKHKSISGAMNLTYPQEWEGHLEGDSVDGALHLQGKDLELIRQEEKPGSNKVEAKKGSGKSSMVFSTVSGGCDVQVGKSR
ncbi:hypothetical protein K504DRAFT_508233 [Pleomassaria siparia CBS 279.74]|uniref:Adhesin domain-containing protein n=1 Tax=Pleomassaria siparia CBS 279.74 TaxID=1314801 RepID=A0A6G1JRT1_9PLEO|nr:hypothetical protein K504DRAFT_508233 [Pleomassaria siparia CBS 279.74]